MLGASKEGVFTADFLSPNGTTVSVRDGGTAILDCRVYLRHDKTVGEIKRILYVLFLNFKITSL